MTASIPGYEEGALLVRQAREAGHVQHAPGAVAHVRQHERRHARPMLGQRGRDAGRAVDQEEFVAQRPRQALHDVQVRPKVAALCELATRSSRSHSPLCAFAALNLLEC